MPCKPYGYSTPRDDGLSIRTGSPRGQLLPPPEASRFPSTAGSGRVPARRLFFNDVTSQATVFHEIHLSPFEILRTSVRTAADVSISEANAVQRMLYIAPNAFEIEFRFRSIERIVLTYRPFNEAATVAVVSVGGHHALTAGIFGGDPTTSEDATAFDGFHEGLSYLAIRFDPGRRALPFKLLPRARPALFLVDIDGFSCPALLPDLHAFMRVLMVAFLLQNARRRS